jgi:hypothetical protein
MATAIAITHARIVPEPRSRPGRFPLAVRRFVVRGMPPVRGGAKMAGLFGKYRFFRFVWLWLADRSSCEKWVDWIRGSRMGDLGKDGDGSMGGPDGADHRRGGFW